MSVSVLASSFQPLRSRTAEWAARIAMIRRAKTFLYSSTYYVGPDSFGEAILDALGDAAERGVRTTLIVDQFGQWLGSSAWGFGATRRVRRWMKRARSRGVNIAWTGSSSWTRFLVGGGHHVKVQLCESGPALFASSNLSHHSFDSWGEFSALLDGPIVQSLLDSVTAVTPGTAAETLDPRPPGASPIEFQWLRCDPNVDPTPFAPVRMAGPNIITDRLVASMNAAQSSIGITSFYVKPEARLRAAILDAARRGVQVEIYHSGADALSGAEASWLAAALDYPAWLDAGVAVHEVASGEHSKLLLVDDKEAVFGSYNFDHAAHDVVTEAMLASRDPRVVDAIRAVFDDLRTNPKTRRVLQPRWKWSRRRRAHARLVRPFRRWL